MSPNHEQKSFFDRSTLTAFVVIMAFWFGWSYFMEKKYPKTPAATSLTAANKNLETTPSSPNSAVTVPSPETKASAAPENLSETTTPEWIKYSSAELQFEISNIGMGFKDIQVSPYRTRDDKPVVLASIPQNFPFSTLDAVTGKPLVFKIEKESENVFVGRARLGSAVVEKRITVIPSLYKFDSEVKVIGADASFKGLKTNLTEQHVVAKSTFLVPSHDHQEFIVEHDATTTRHIVDQKSDTDAVAEKKTKDMELKNATLAALSSHYFAIAILDSGSSLLPRFERPLIANNELTTGYLVYEPVNPVAEFTFKYAGYAGPKNFDLLEKIDPRLPKIIDYGMFAVIAKPLLWLMQFFFEIVGNYGLAIILVTLVVRGLLLPLNVYSFRSMKIMQKLQPQIKDIQARFKDDKVRQNNEVMALMKSNKANPLGGCLPMLLQLPIFFALYQVLANSIELYRAPFALWIHDLSAADPFFVLPVLMGITMFLQQKMTPTAMDPAQAKILMWMPLIFSIFMVSLPSGLTLYMFVSGLFGIIQTYFFMREKQPNNAAVTQAKA